MQSYLPQLDPYQNKLKLVQSKSIRAHDAINPIFIKNARGNSKITEKTKNFFLERLVNILTELDESELISEKYKGLKIKDFIDDPNEFNALLNILLIGTRIYNDTENLDAKSIFAKFGYAPVMQQVAHKEEITYKLVYIDPDNEVPELREMKFNQTAINFCILTRFKEQKNGHFVQLTQQDRNQLLKTINIYDQLIKSQKFYASLFAAALIYIFDKNEFDFNIFVPTKKEALEDKNRGFNKLREIKDTEFGHLQEENLAESIPFFKFNSNAGIAAAEPFTLLPRMKVRVHSSTSEHPSPYEMAMENGKIKSVSFSRAFFLQLTCAFENASTFPIILNQALKRNHCAHAFRPVQARNIFQYIRDKYKKNLVQTVADPCGGWGDRLVAFLADAAINRILINDANPEMPERYRAIIKAYAKAKIKFTELMSYAFELIPEEVLKKITNIFDLIFTSPPYFCKELYHGVMSSHKLYKTFEEWVQAFLRISLLNSYYMANDEGVIVFCVANVNFKRKTLPIVDKTREIMSTLCDDITLINYGQTHNKRNLNTAEVFVIGKVNKYKLLAPISTNDADEKKIATNEPEIAEHNRKVFYNLYFNCDSAEFKKRKEKFKLLKIHVTNHYSNSNIGTFKQLYMAIKNKFKFPDNKKLSAKEFESYLSAEKIAQHLQFKDLISGDKNLNRYLLQSRQFSKTSSQPKYYRNLYAFLITKDDIVFNQLLKPEYNELRKILKFLGIDCEKSIQYKKHVSKIEKISEPDSKLMPFSSAAVDAFKPSLDVPTPPPVPAPLAKSALGEGSSMEQPRPNLKRKREVKDLSLPTDSFASSSNGSSRAMNPKFELASFSIFPTTREESIDSVFKSLHDELTDKHYIPQVDEKTCKYSCVVSNKENHEDLTQYLHDKAERWNLLNNDQGKILIDAYYYSNTKVSCINISLNEKPQNYKKRKVS